MGLSKSKTKNDPWKPAQPFILKNLQQQDAVFNSTQPQLEAYAGQQRDTYGRIAPGAEQGITGAQSLVNRNLSGANLNGNPYLDAVIGTSRDNALARVGDEFGTAGRFGGGMHQAIAMREALNAENQLRYQDYGQERAYQQDAIGQAGQLMQGSQGILNNAAELPWLGIQAANGAVRQASAGYGTTTTKQALGPMLMQAAANAGQAAAASDRRLKKGIKLLSRLRDGLGVYSWNYRQDSPLDLPTERQVGVMADEVAALRPWALAPRVEGFAHVNYGAL